MGMLAAALLAVLPVTHALADPPMAEDVKDQPGNEPTVTRGMPDLVRYWNFDPPKSPLFDIGRVTISGDARIRPEYRNNSNFGLTSTSGAGRATGANSSGVADQFVQQWARLGLNYAVSPDVDTFFQMQYAKNWGSNNSPSAANDANTLSSVGIRQAYILIRNLGVEGLSLKGGRQLIVMGNQRLFGSFDWNNIGFSFDGVTLQYSQKMYEVWGGWVRLADTEANAANSSCGIGTTGCAGGGGTVSTGAGNANADLFFARMVLKPMAGLSIEPLWVYLDNNTHVAIGGNSAAGTATTFGGTAAHAPGQQRHTLGGRVAYRQGMFDGTAEYYWQTGSMGLAESSNRLHINANAIAVEGGLTFEQLPWTPRLGLEFNYASGDGSAKNCNGNTGTGCGGNANTFENLYPTNHILMGYADRMAWRNMVGYSASLQAKPSIAQQLDFRFWIFRKANNGDCWYTASQACFSTATATGNSGGAGNAGGVLAPNVATSNSLYKEIDGVYTLFFKDNKVAWQTGASYLIAGKMLDQLAAGNAAGSGSSAVNSIWVYTQIHVNF
jgi:hypothetical protein